MGSSADAREVRTFCRVCEPACGLVARVRDGRLEQLRPDRQHPITRGFACNRGIAGLDIHHDPDRLNHPLRRGAAGDLERVEWDAALHEIAARLRGIVERHGPNAVAGYIGNPTAFNSLFAPASAAFFGQLGTRRMFSSGTQDCANKFAGSEAVFGSSTIHPIPDIDHTDHLLIFGENPRVSHMSFLAVADPMRVLKEARKRGAKLRFVNPRRIESAGPETGDVVQIRPDTDLYLLAAMLCAIDADPGFDAEVLQQHAVHVEGLRAFVHRYPPERVAPVVGLEAGEIRELAREFATAASASLHMSTGVNMGRQGTLAYWLLHMLSLVTGNLDRRGGNLLSVGFYPNAKAGRRRYEDGFTEGPHGRMRKGTLPGNLLPHAIEDPDQPIRALIVIAGNPLLSIGGEDALRRAFERLELTVSIDLYRNASGEYADFLLPATDMFERPDVNITGLGLQHTPYVQFSERVVEPQHERREEWWILGRLCQELGLKSAFDGGNGDEEVLQRLDHMLARSELSVAHLREQPHGVELRRPEPDRLLGEFIQTADGRVDCCPPAFAPALERAEEIFGELAAEPSDALKLITKRDPFMHNSWYHNVEKMKRGERDRNYLFMHPDDARARSLANGDLARVHNAWGAIEAPVKLADDLRPGVVAMTHGWGHERAPGMRVAQRTAGVNVNVLLPIGPGSFDPLSNQAHMTGIPVEVARV